MATSALNLRFEIIEEVWSARVPILKLRFDGKTDVDLSCHNLQALQNTYLLWARPPSPERALLVSRECLLLFSLVSLSSAKAYSMLNPVVRGLVITVKLWAKLEGSETLADEKMTNPKI